MTDEVALTYAESSDARQLRDLFGTVLTGVTVVTAYEPDGTPRGFTANSFTSVSLDPPLILICVGNNLRSRSILESARRFGVNILRDEQQHLSARFASRTENKFAGITLPTETDGPPLLSGSLSVLDCERVSITPAGDHVIVIGRVLRFGTGSGTPLGFYRGTYVSFGLGTTALERQGGTAVVLGCLLEAGDKLLLCRRPGATAWEVPAVPLVSGQDHRTLIPALLENLGVTGEASLLYSVFQEQDDAHMTMIFKGHIVEPDELLKSVNGVTLRLFGKDEKPWEVVAGPSIATAVRRF